MAKKKDNDEIESYKVVKRVRTYNPADKPAKNSSKTIKVRESKSDKKAQEKIEKNSFKREKRDGYSEKRSAPTLIFWGIFFLAVIIGLCYWQRAAITSFFNNIFNEAYVWAGWGVVVVLLAILIAIVIINRRPIGKFFVEKLHVGLWHYAIGAVLLTLAVWGVLGLFDLGGRIGLMIVGEYMIINYLRVAALFILSFVAFFPGLSWRAVKKVASALAGLFKPMDPAKRKPRKEKEPEFNPDFTESYQIADGYQFGKIGEESDYDAPTFTRQQDAINASTSGGPRITGRMATASVEPQEPVTSKQKISYNVSGYVDPRKYQEAKKQLDQNGKPARRVTEVKETPTSKYGNYGYANTQSYQNPPKSSAPAGKSGIKIEDYMFSNPYKNAAPSSASVPNTPITPPPTSSSATSSFRSKDSNILKFQEVEPYITESPIPKTKDADFKKTPLNDYNPTKIESTRAASSSGFTPKSSYTPSSSSKKGGNVISSDFLPFDLFGDSGKKTDKAVLDANPYKTETAAPKKEENTLKDEIEANKASAPYVPVQGKTVDSDSGNWRPNLDKLEAKDDGWKLPETDLLIDVKQENVDEADNQHRADMIEEALASYGVDAKVVAINPGPSITQFGVEPGFEYKIKKVKSYDEEGNPITIEEKIPGNRVKVEKIKGLADDLALALQAPSIMIQAPVPNQSYVGIEIPNKVYSTVTLRSILEDGAFKKISAKSGLAIALGQGTSGEFVSADLAKMPHLLIAGATGSGKSVCMNALISCLIMNNTPTELKMIMIDPKRVEMTQFKTLPHLLTPVIVDTDKAMAALRWLQMEMENRLKMLEQARVRNIDGYNEGRVGLERMPKIVLIIDELADLMMTGLSEVETILCRLAQLARAVGIHLVVATQRPSVDVITGLIKANFPTRISFAVTSLVDSRTILDMAGAEKLLGHGDMLYAPPGVKPIRLQGCFLSDTEIERLVYFWGQQNGINTPMIDLATVPIPGNGAGAAKNNPGEDVLMPKVREMGKTQKITSSLLQRKLGIGYPRAARLADNYRDEMAGIGGAEVPADDDEFDY